MSYEIRFLNNVRYFEVRYIKHCSPRAGVFQRTPPPVSSPTSNDNDQQVFCYKNNYKQGKVSKFCIFDKFSLKKYDSIN